MASMWIRKLFRNTTHSTIRKARTAKPAAGQHRLRIEPLEDRVVPTILVGLDVPYHAPLTVKEGPGVVVGGTWFDNSLAATDFTLAPSALPSNLTFSGFSFTTNPGSPRNGSFSFTLTPLDGVTNAPTTPSVSGFSVVGGNDKGDTSTPQP